MNENIASLELRAMDVTKDRGQWLASGTDDDDYKCPVTEQGHRTRGSIGIEPDTAHGHRTSYRTRA